MFKELDTEGYVICKSIFPKELLEEYYQRYLISQHKFVNQNYKVVFGDLKGTFRKIILDTLLKISKESRYSYSLLSNNTIIFNSDYVNLHWHQDHEVYFLFQESTRYVNFWIPLIKPDCVNDGIELIPNTRWGELSEKIINNGAQNFEQIDQNTISIVDVDKDIIYQEEFNLNDNKVIPSVEVGDCVIFRGDVVHRTQPDSKNRVAVSVWAFNNEIEIKAEKYFNQGNYKKEMISKNNNIAYKFLSDVLSRNSKVSIKNVIPIYF